MGKLDSKVAVVTGAGSGIGRAIALLFAGEGAKVVVDDFVRENAAETAGSIKAKGGEASYVVADVSRADDVKNMFRFAISTYGKLDILVNNAGTQPPLASLIDTTEETWDRVLSVNLKGVFLGMKYGIPYMLENGGVIINTASTTGLVAYTCECAYGASKAGVIELTKTAALEFAKHKIRVNCICPGLIKTPLADKISNSPEMAMLKPVRSSRAISRIGVPEDIAQAALFLACEESAGFITGTELIVDGGYLAL